MIYILFLYANTDSKENYMSYIKWFSEIGIKDVAEVGGKNASKRCT